MFPTGRCWLVIFLTLFSYLSFTDGHSRYVPETKEVCETMNPHHKREPQTTESPFKVIVYAEKVQPGKTISISLVAEEETKKCRLSRFFRCDKHDKKGFKGFYIQARESRENRPIGKFIPKEDETVKVHNCGGGSQNAAFHGVKGHKTNVTVEWTAPVDFQGKIIFTTTFVKKYHKYWTQVKSSPVSVRTPFCQIQL